MPYAKAATSDGNALLYKLTKGDSAIVRWVLEGNGTCECRNRDRFSVHR